MIQGEALVCRTCQASYLGGLDGRSTRQELQQNKKKYYNSWLYTESQLTEGFNKTCPKMFIKLVRHKTAYHNAFSFCTVHVDDKTGLTVVINWPKNN